MRLLEGCSLGQHLAQVGQLSVVEAIALTRKIAAAVGHAHQAGVIHRDLKPENVFLTKEGEVLVLDWGCLQVLEESTARATGRGGPMCTPGYAPPEQLLPGARPEPSMDVYALGVVLYELLAGSHPFLGVRRGRVAPERAVSVSGKLSALFFSQRPTLRGMLTADAARFMAQPTNALQLGPTGTLRLPETPLQSTRTASRRGTPRPAVARPDAERRRAIAPIPPRFGDLPLRDVVELQQRVALEPVGGVPDPLWRLLRSMLDRRASERPQTMQAVVEELDIALPLAQLAPNELAHVTKSSSLQGAFARALAKLRRDESIKRYGLRSGALGLASVVAVGVFVKVSEHPVATPSEALAGHAEPAVFARSGKRDAEPLEIGPNETSAPLAAVTADVEEHVAVESDRPSPPRTTRSLRPERARKVDVTEQAPRHTAASPSKENTPASKFELPRVTAMPPGLTPVDWSDPAPEPKPSKNAARSESADPPSPSAEATPTTASGGNKVWVR